MALLDGKVAVVTGGGTGIGRAVSIGLAAAGWFAAFALLAWRVIPFLLAPRIDGREH